jgi:VanZ family protein
LAVTVLGVLPDYDALPDLLSFSDLLNHAVAFLILYLLFERAFPHLKTSDRFVLLFLFAFFIELVQLFLPTRTASISDIAADVAGMLFALLLTPLLRKTPLIKNCYRY